MTAQFTQETLSKLSPRDLKLLIWRQKWLMTARPEQIPPAGEWNELIYLSGRGWGKTVTGAQWLAYEAVMDPEALPSAVIAPTLNDVRYTCFEGHTGILNLVPPDMIKDYNKTNLIITLDTGAIIRGFSAEEPERLRGPQFARGLLEELAAWGATDEATFDMFMMGLRLGPNPKFVVTTTPKPRELVRKLATPKPGRMIMRGSTYDNRANLPKSFFDQLAQYEGTQLGRQELEGELIDAEEGGIISRSWLRLWPAKQPLPAFDWILMSLDTAFTERTLDKKTHNADPTACGVFGVFQHEDRSNFMLLDCWQDHLGFPDLIKKVKRESKQAYGADSDAPLLRPLIGPNHLEDAGKKIDLIIIEDKGSGISLRQALEREGVMTFAYNPGRADKTARLHMVSHIFANRQVWLPESEKFPGRHRTWADPLVTQLCSFRGPNSIKHDDFVDVCSQAIRIAIDKGLMVAKKKGRLDREDRDREHERETAVARQGPRVNPYAV